MASVGNEGTEMTILLQYLGLLITHYIADFVCQSHWMASNKSKDNLALLSHVVVYSIVLLAVSLILFMSMPTHLIMLFVLLNGVLHFFTDYVTSRVTSKLYAKQAWHNFFVVIGLDQLIHQLTLAGTMIWIFGGSIV